MSHQPYPRAGSPAYRVSRVLILFIYGLAITCIVILAIAFFLQLFNANATAPFVDWVYRAAKRIMQPFRGIFPSVEGEQGSVFDVSMLFAMFMYGLLAFGLHALIAWIDRRIAAARNEFIWQSSATPATSQDVVTIPAAAPPAPSTVPPATTTPPGPPAAPGEAPGDRR
jgi:uncharacterized protein YggT (Ycf19 family)